MIAGPEKTQPPKGGGLEPLIELVAAHPFLAGMKPGHLRVLAENAMLVQYETGETVFRRGEPANRFYLIESGKVSLELFRENQATVAIQTIGPGEVLGWSWLFEPYYWQFDARAIDPTTAIFFYATRLREQCEQDHDLGYELMKRMAAVVINRLQATRNQLLTGSGEGMTPTPLT
ncbi:MAG: Crp/Fnr family transcriptional regulator [Limisphaerales bacterium]